MQSLEGLEMKLVINSQVSLAEAQAMLARKFKEDKYVVCTIQKQQRTMNQNRAMHLYFSMVACDLNAAGLDIQKTMKETFCIPWSESSVKALIWHPVMQAMFETDSTAKLTTEQVSKIYDVVHRHLSQTHGINVAFPSRDNL